MRIEVSGRKFSFPPFCACCGGAADSFYTASSLKTTGRRSGQLTEKGWNFPYCSHCLSHIQGCRKAEREGVFIALGFIAVAACLEVAIFKSGWVVFAALAGGFVAGWRHTFQKKKAVEDWCKPSCVSTDISVRYSGWQGTIHSFEILSEKFAAEFLRLNAEKVVNGGRDVQRLLFSFNADRNEKEPQVQNDFYLPLSPKSAILGEQEEDAIDEFAELIAKLESSKGPASRRAIVSQAEKRFAQRPATLEKFLIEASKVEVERVLDKVDRLQTKSAKRRALKEAIDQLKSDSVSDVLQAKELELLRSALDDVDDSPKS